MSKIVNANNVSLAIQAVGESSISITAAARVSVDNFNFGVDNDTQPKSGVGNQTPKGVTEGNTEYTFSFVAEGHDAKLLRSLMNSDGTPKEVAFTADSEEFTVEMSEGYVSPEYSGQDGQAVQWSFEGVAVVFDINYK